MSQLIEKFRTTHKGVPPEKLVGVYFDLLNKIEQSKKEKDFNKMLMYCQMSISLLEPLIEQTKKEFGMFDIKSIPAIEIGSVFLAIYGMRGQLLNFKEVIEYFPELNPWRESIERAITMQNVASKIYRYVKNNEGCLRAELKKALGVEDGRMVSRVVYYMELIGKLKKEKSGKIYSLSINP